jgi:MFS family permease
VAFFVAVGYGLIIPAIPVFTKSFGVSNTAIGLIVSSFALARFSSGLISGKLVDRFGERQVLTVGLLFVAASTLASGLAANYWQLLIFRSAGGLGSSMFSVSASALLMRSIGDSDRGRAQSTYNGAFLIGGIAGPAVGGLLMSISLRIPFFIYTATLIMASATASIFLRESRLGPTFTKINNMHEKIPIRTALALYPYRAALAISFLSNWVLFGIRNSVLPLFVKGDLHSTSVIVGYGFTISAIAQGTVLLYSGKLSDQKGRRFVLLVGSSLLLGAVTALVLAHNIWFFFGSMAFFGLGGAFIGTGHANVVGDLFGGKGGQVIAIWQMAGDAGMIVGPIVVGWIADAHTYRMAFLVSGAIFMAAPLLAARMGETRKTLSKP